VCGIEIDPHPLGQLLVLLVRRVAERRQEVAIAPGAAAVLGRAGPLSGEADGTSARSDSLMLDGTSIRRQTGGFTCRRVTFSLYTVFA